MSYWSGDCRITEIISAHSIAALYNTCTGKGTSKWLTANYTSEYGFTLHKNAFQDAFFLCYGWPLSRLPEKCDCGHQFNIEHALSCSMGGFPSLQHNIKTLLLLSPQWSAIVSQLNHICNPYLESNFPVPHPMHKWSESGSGNEWAVGRKVWEKFPWHQSLQHFCTIKLPLKLVAQAWEWEKKRVWAENIKCLACFFHSNSIVMHRRTSTNFHFQVHTSCFPFSQQVGPSLWPNHVLASLQVVSDHQSRLYVARDPLLEKPSGQLNPLTVLLWSHRWPLGKHKLAFPYPYT